MNGRLSILVPMYNEAEVIPVFFDTINKVLAATAMDYEIICINDGSRDNTLELLTVRAAQDRRIKVISFSRNFGKEAAMSAALDYASGDAAIPIDADLQDPPELIHGMLAKWKEGYDVVFAKRSSRASDSIVKRKTAHWFYNLFNRLSEVDIPENVGDYRLMSRRVLDAIKRLPEKERFMKGLFCWPGFKSTTLEFERQLRAGGSTKFNYWKLWNFALSGITSFSTIPIRMGIYLGLIIAGLAFVYGCYIIIRTLILGIDEPGYASIMVVVLFLGGVQLFCFGLMGEYIGRIYKEVKNRPLYVVERAIGFDSKP
jgi:glycosyltransferase involved in cell wall biosynthesis